MRASGTFATPFCRSAAPYSRAWPRRRGTPIRREEQVGERCDQDVRGSRALGNHPNRVTHDPERPRTPRRSGLGRLLVSPRGAAPTTRQAWTLPALADDEEQLPGRRLFARTGGASTRRLGRATVFHVVFPNGLRQPDVRLRRRWDVPVFVGISGSAPEFG